MANAPAALPFPSLLYEAVLAGITALQGLQAKAPRLIKLRLGPFEQEGANTFLQGTEKA